MKTIKLFVTAFFLGMFLCLLVSCNILHPDEKLTLQRKDYAGNELRIDGYYYYFVQGVDRTVVRFLYKNGIVLWGGTYGITNINEVESEMLGLYSTVRKMKESWGVFLVEDDKIQYETWAEAPDGVCLATRKYFGYIENDTTIHITESYYSGRNETRNEIWHFKQFDNKPDSTNKFIK